MPKEPAGTESRRGPGPAREKPLRTLHIVRWLYTSSPDRFTVNDIAEQYGIKRGEAYRRVQYMLVYQLAKKIGHVEAHRAGRKETAYALTDWGRKYATDQAKQSAKSARRSSGGRAAANPEE